MTKHECWESFKAEAATVGERLKKILHEGNVSRIIVEHRGRTVAEFPLTAGVVSVLVAPVLAAVGAMVALLRDCVIHVERAEGAEAATTAAKPGVHAAVDVEC